MIRKLLIFITLLLLTSAYVPSAKTGDKKESYVPLEQQMEESFLSLHEPSLSRDAYRLALQGYQALLSEGRITNDSVLSIIDFTLPSSDYRFFVINLKRNRVIFKTLVSHGCNSGELYAIRFSNKLQSHQSALGFYITGDTYTGSQGYSLLLDGVDAGYNDLARKRCIVIHGADYVSEEFISRNGRLGRSFGCPALPALLCVPIIDSIKGGSVLFSYYSDITYPVRSRVLNPSADKAT
jgi:hypothetical protein